MKDSLKTTFIYFFLRGFTFFLSLFPLFFLRVIGKGLGKIAFFTMREYRKRALSNLALADALQLGKKEIFTLAKKAFENLAINALEYAKFSRKKDLSRMIVCKNQEVASACYREGKGIVFFCAHLANWEVLFLDGTKRMKGVAIGKPIKNRRLYRWVVSIREKFGGKIVLPKNGVKEGLKALKKGAFFGIVGDQGMPSSNYSFPFFGRRAWTSTAPALLSYRTGAPLFFAEVIRVKKGYEILYHGPIYPDKTAPMEEETKRMMDLCLTMLEESVRKNPGDYLWMHNRYKQETICTLYKRFRQDSLLILFDAKNYAQYGKDLSTFKTLYPNAFITLYLPKNSDLPLIEVDELYYYENLSEVFKIDYRFKLVLNFTENKKVAPFFTKLSATSVLGVEEIYHIAEEHLDQPYPFSEIVKRAFSKPGTLWEKSCR